MLCASLRNTIFDEDSHLCEMHYSGYCKNNVSGYRR
nr:MAG TPA_asm: hypothetical protein [Caudoviricetes sp.]